MGWHPTEIWTDGSCLPNKCGGWAAIILEDGVKKEISGSENATTSNRMELRAAIQSLMCVKRWEVLVYTDSQYLKEGMSSWIRIWLYNGWINSAGKEVKNKDLWIELLEQSNKHDITWVWVKGHSTDVNNARCDVLAKEAARSTKIIL